MVRPSQERQTLVLTDAQSVSIGSGTSVGDDDIDFDGGGGTNPDSAPITPPAPNVVEVITDSSTWDKVLDWSVAVVWDITLGANLSGIAFANPPAAGLDAKMEVTYRQPAAGGPFTLVQPAEVDWQDTDGTAGGPGPTMPTADESLLVVVYDVRDGGASYGGTYDSVASPPAPGTLPWFTVTDYGAVGDGSTDDLTAVNDAIAALIAAGAGVLYFPATPDSYYVSAGLDAITAPCTIMGDGQGSTDGAASIIETDHATDVLFTVSADGVRFTGLRLLNTNGSETDGAAIAPTTGNGKHCRYDNLWVEGFRDGLSLLYGWEWSMEAVHVTNPVRYGIHVKSTDLADAGDWAIVNCWFGTRTRDATSAIRIESAGGGKIANVKVNANPVADHGGGIKRYVTGIDLNITDETTILLVSNTSVENVSGDGILLAKTGGASYKYVLIHGYQAGLYGNNTGYAIKATAGISECVFSDLAAKTDGTARPAISLTSTNDIAIGLIQLEGFNARYTGSGDSNTFDLMAGGASVALDDLTDVTIASPTLGDVLTYDGAEWIADAPATGGGGTHELLISSTPSNPIVFGDVILNSDGTDFLYSS